MSSKKPLLGQYDLHTLLFNNVLVDISEEESTIRLVPAINHVKWLAGHLVWGQGGLARMGGVDLNVVWLDHYNTQLTQPPGPELPIPTLEEIMIEWNKYAAPIRDGLEKISQQALDTPIEFPMPAFATLEGLWTFINHHQAYTIGQIGIVRRGLGKNAMKYF